jgi:hypothetical protein
MTHSVMLIALSDGVALSYDPKFGDFLERFTEVL